MTISEENTKRLSTLFEAIAHDQIGAAEVHKELKSLRSDLAADPYRRGKINEAIHWAEIYFSPRKWQRWGRREVAKGHLLNKVYSAEHNHMDNV